MNGITSARQGPLSAARVAFDNARTLILTLQPRGSPLHHWLCEQHNQHDVRAAVEDSIRLYHARRGGRTREWLTTVSTFILSYGKALDMLVQHHPEYVALAWGTTKFLFVLFQNHDEIITELVKTLADVSELLPRTELYLNLYSDPALQLKAELMFKLLIEHSYEMLKFFKEGRLKHAWKAFLQPYSLRFKKLKDDIDDCSRSIEIHVRARGHEVLRNVLQEQTATRNEVATLRQEFQRFVTQSQAQNVLMASMSISQRRVEMSSMLIQAANATISPPFDSLQLRLAHLRRQASKLNIHMQDVWRSTALRTWSFDQRSHVLVVRGSWANRNDINAVGTQITKLATNSDFMVIWALQNHDSQASRKFTWTEILKYLIVQSMQQNFDRVCASLSNDFNLSNLATSTTNSHWEAVFLKTLLGLRVVYIVIDLGIIEDVLTEPENIVTIFQSLRRLLSANQPTTLKIAIINQGRQRGLERMFSNSCAVDIDQLVRRRRAGPRSTSHMTQGITSRTGAPLAFRSRNKSVPPCVCVADSEA